MLEPLKDRIHYPRKALLLRLARALGGERLLLRLARLCYHLQVEGGDRIPRQGGCLVAFNHVSNIADGLIYLVVRRRRPDVHLYSWDLTGDVIAGLLGAFGYPQPEQGLLLAHKRHALSVSALLQARQILATGGCVMIAPEGEITWDGRLQHPLAPGAAWLALRSAAPIIPVVSRGGYDVQPLWQIDKIRLTGRISIRAGQPLVLCEAPLKQVSSAQLEQASQQLWQAMTTLLSG